MPTRGDTQINTFVKGLVTDASPLSYPPNTCLDLINFRLNKDGTIFRRLGVDFEDNYLLTATGYSTDVLATARKAFYHWPLPNGNALVDIGVVQIGAKFWFLNLYAESPSTAILNGGNAVTAAVDPSSRFSFAVINNYLLVVSNNLPDPYLVSYDYALDSITFETSPILVRDLWGVDDELDVGARPTTLTPKHYYNLLNQGWSNGIVSTCTPAGISAIDCTFITLGVYPANSDVWTIGRVGDLTSADVYKYDPNIAKRNIFNIGQVPQGHYILPLKNRGADRQLQTGLTVPMDREIGTISCVAAYAGRAFYAGILSEVQDGDSRSPLLTGAVLFSQTFEQKIQLVKCYQEADPTSPDISDVLDTDGGIIFIPECSAINHLRAIKESLFVFAVNGIWEIRGGENGFTATSFQVNKVSNVGVYSPDSIVEINGQILFWGVNGIYAITKNQFGIYETNSITKNVIQKYYDSLPDWARTQAKGYYDLNSNTVRWLFYSDDAKVAGQAIDTQPPTPVVYLAGTSAKANTTAGQIEPKVVKLTDTTFLTVYRDSSTGRNIRCRIGTVASDLSITYNTEQLLFTAAASCVGYSLCYLEDNRVLFTYSQSGTINARVLTVSGSTVTTTGATALNAVSNSTYLTSPIRSALVSAGKVIICFSNTDSSKVSLQIVNISSANVITFGAVAKNGTTSCVRHNLALLSSSAGVTSTFSSRVQMETFTIVGDVVTFSGVVATFLNTTQLPAPTTHTIGTGFMHPIDVNKVYVVGVTSTASPTISSAMYSFIATMSGSTITSTTLLKQDTETGTIPVSMLLNNKSVVQYRKLVSGNNYIPRLLVNINSGDTPATSYQQSPVTAETVNAIESTSLTKYRIVTVWEGNASGTDVIALAQQLP